MAKETTNVDEGLGEGGFVQIPLKEGSEDKCYRNLMRNYHMMQEVRIGSLIEDQSLIWTSPDYALFLSFDMLRPFKDLIERSLDPMFRDLLTYDLGGYIGQVLNSDPYGLDLDVYTDAFAPPDERYRPGAFLFRRTINSHLL